MKITRTELKEMIREELQSIYENNGALNKKVHTLLSNELDGLSPSETKFAVLQILRSALQSGKSVKGDIESIFKGAKYGGHHQNEKAAMKQYTSVGKLIGMMCGGNSDDILSSVGFYVSMEIGRPMGQKIISLLNENKSTPSDTITVMNELPFSGSATLRNNEIHYYLDDRNVRKEAFTVKKLAKSMGWKLSEDNDDILIFK